MGVKGWNAQVVASLVFAAIFGVLAWQQGIYPISAAVYNGWRAADYVEVKATVAIRERMDANGPFKYLVLRYERNGKHYETTRMTVLADTDVIRRANAEVIRQLLRSAPNATVWVDPLRPEIAVASRDLPWASMWPRLPHVVTFALHTLWCVVFALYAARGINIWWSLVIVGVLGAWSIFCLWGFVIGTDTTADLHLVPAIRFGLLLVPGLVVSVGLLPDLLRFDKDKAATPATRASAPVKAPASASASQIRRQVVTAAVMAFFFFLLAWFFGLRPIVYTAGNWVQASGFVKVPAVVEVRSAEDRLGTFDYVVLLYERNGQRHETSRMSVLEDRDIDARANALVIARLGEPGSTASVWVSPRRPDVAVASRDFPWTSLWPRLPVVLGFSLLTATYLGISRQAWRGKDTTAYRPAAFSFGLGLTFMLALFVSHASHGEALDYSATMASGLGVIVFVLLDIKLLYWVFDRQMKPLFSRRS